MRFLTQFVGPFRTGDATWCCDGCREAAIAASKARRASTTADDRRGQTGPETHHVPGSSGAATDPAQL